MQDGDWVLCVYIGAGCALVYTDVIILRCCLFVYILKPVGVVCGCGGRMCPGHSALDGALCVGGCSDVYTLGCSLCRYWGSVYIECIPQDCGLEFRLGEVGIAYMCRCLCTAEAHMPLGLTFPPPPSH